MTNKISVCADGVKVKYEIIGGKEVPVFIIPPGMSSLSPEQLKEMEEIDNRVIKKKEKEEERTIPDEDDFEGWQDYEPEDYQWD